MNIIDIFVIACTLILGTLTITGGKKQSGMKGIFYLISSFAFLILGIIILHIRAALVTFAVFCVVFSITFIMAFKDAEKEKSKLMNLGINLKKQERNEVCHRDTREEYYGLQYTRRNDNYAH